MPARLALARPVPGLFRASPSPASPGRGAEPPAEGPETTHLVVTDRWGNVVAYNITIESTGGNGIVVPGRGFLLNNELTDFTFGPAPGDSNLPGPGKRPRSSMAPTIVLAEGKPLLALGSPGGSTIITTVLQILVNRWELGMPLPEALAAPGHPAQHRPDPGRAGLPRPLRRRADGQGHSFALNPEIGAATAVEFLGRGRLQAVAEPSRRGGGSALVVVPAR
nr:hypothetical protein GCM10020093_095240 [Planobispora longispora]